MDALFSIINKPLGFILKFIAEIFGGSFAVAVFVFTILINLALIPLSIKSQKSSVQQTRIKPKLDELKKKYGDDKQRYSQEMQKLYQEENVSMSGGCLPMIFRLVLMMSIYYLILSPLTYMTGIEEAKVKNVTKVVSSTMADLKDDDEDKYNEVAKKLDWEEKNQSNQLGLVRIIRGNTEVLKDILSEKDYKKIEKDLKYIEQKDEEIGINYNLFTEKIDLTESPKFSFDIIGSWKPIWLMPLLAFACQMFTSWLSMRMQKKINPDAPSMAGMMLTMPLISLFIGFALPGGVTFYWACSSLIGGFIQMGVQNFYGPHKMLSRERMKELTKQCDFEALQISKHSTADGGEN